MSHAKDAPSTVYFGGHCREEVCKKPCTKCVDKQPPEVKELKAKVADLEKQLEAFTNQETLFQNPEENTAVIDVSRCADANIHSPPGTKIVFLGENGYTAELLDALNVLKKGRVYTLKSTNIDNCYTDFELEEFPGRKWNSVMFGEMTQ